MISVFSWLFGKPKPVREEPFKEFPRARKVVASCEKWAHQMRSLNEDDGSKELNRLLEAVVMQGKVNRLSAPVKFRFTVEAWTLGDELASKREHV